MKLHPVHAFSGLVGIIFVLLAIIFIKSAMSSGYDAGVAGGGQSPTDVGSIIVYGSKTCPWCVKQEKYLTEKGFDYQFVNCPTDGCPEFVNGYPTLMVNNEIKNGYTELGGPLSHW